MINENFIEILPVGEFVFVQQTNNQWPLLFDTYFISKDTRLPPISANTTSADDLIFYVTKKVDEKSQNIPVGFFYLRKERFHSIFMQNVVEVFRHHDEKRQPTVVRRSLDLHES